MSFRVLQRALPAACVAGVTASLLLAPRISIDGPRGLASLAPGFRPGRWDADFLVARGPAGLEFVSAPREVRVLLSGPASLRVNDGREPQQFNLTSSPQWISLENPGRHVAFTADAPIRLHALRVVGEARRPWERLLFLLLGVCGALTLALRGRAEWMTRGSVLVALAVSIVSLEDRLGAQAWTVEVRRAGPAILALGLVALIAYLVVRLPRGPVPQPHSRWPLVAALALLVSCLVQVRFFPQPLIAGDPAAYDDIARRFLTASRAVHLPQDVGEAFRELRPYGGLLFTGALYGSLRALHDSPTTYYVAHALAIAAMALFLVRAALRSVGPRVAVIVGVLVFLYAPFAIACGVVQPEPFILFLWCFALDRLVTARQSDDRRAAAEGGLAFAVGLALHPQGFWFLLTALTLCLIVCVSRWKNRRSLVRAFALAALPVICVVAVGERYARPVTSILDERYGFWAYSAPVPLGFWLFLDTDGWQGPLRLDQTRYARGFADEGVGERGALGKAVYTARFIADNVPAAARTVLRNLHRLFHRPDNPFQRDWLLPYGLQFVLHRALVVLFLLSFPLLLREKLGIVTLPFLMLAMTYPLYHVFNKYALPATPFILFGAAIALHALWRLPSRQRLVLVIPLLLSAVGALLTAPALALHGIDPWIAHAVLKLLHWGGLTVALALSARVWSADRIGRASALLAWALLVPPSIAADWGDPGWRRFAVTLDRAPFHRIALSPSDLAALNGSSDAFVFLDLRVPDGDARNVTLTFDGGLSVSGAELEPTMPAFGIATIRGRRDPRTFPQWWRVRWRPEMAHDGAVGVTISGPRSDELSGDVAIDPTGALEGLSLGEWPFLSVYRLMHEGEYRLGMHQPLGGLERESRMGSHRVPGSWGVRLVVIDRSDPAHWRPQQVD